MRIVVSESFLEKAKQTMTFDESDKKIARLTDHSITDRKNYITLVQRTSRSSEVAHQHTTGRGVNQWCWMMVAVLY